MLRYTTLARLPAGESHSVSARLVEDENTRDEVREMASDGYLHY